MKFAFHMWNVNIFTYEIPNSHVKWPGSKFRMWNVGVRNRNFMCEMTNCWICKDKFTLDHLGQIIENLHFRQNQQIYSLKLLNQIYNKFMELIFTLFSTNCWISKKKFRQYHIGKDVPKSTFLEKNQLHYLPKLLSEIYYKFIGLIYGCLSTNWWIKKQMPYYPGAKIIQILHFEKNQTNLGKLLVEIYCKLIESINKKNFKRTGKFPQKKFSQITSMKIFQNLSFPSKINP